MRWMCTVGASLVSSMASGAVIEIVDGTARARNTIAVNVRLRTEGSVIAATENEIHFSNQLSWVSCEANPAINRPASAFAEARGGESAIKSLVLSFSDVSLIPDGSILYTCYFAQPVFADAIQYDFSCLAPGASTPEGEAVAIRCEDGSVVLDAAAPTVPPPPTRNATATPTSATLIERFTPTRTSTPGKATALESVFIELAPVAVSPEEGGEVTVRVTTLDGNGARVEGVGLSFETAPQVGEFAPLNGRTSTTVLPDGSILEGVSETNLYLAPREMPEDGLDILACSTLGCTSTRLRAAERIVQVGSVLLEQRDGCRSEVNIDGAVVANVLDTEGRPINGIAVLFEADVGSFFPFLGRSGESGFGEGVAESTLIIPEGQPIRMGSDGSIEPYLITARAGGAVGSARIFVVPGREPCDSVQATRSPVDPNRGFADDSSCSIATGPSGSLVWLPLVPLLTAIVRRWLGGSRQRNAGPDPLCPRSAPRCSGSGGHPGEDPRLRNSDGNSETFH